MTQATVRVPIGKIEGRITRLQEDILAVEEPLEIRVGSRSLSVTMRTPGHDFELAAGFLFAEDIISSAGQIRSMESLRPNIVAVELSPDAVIERPKSQRGFVMTSACGLCGKNSLKSLAANRCPVLPPSGLKIDAGVIHRLPQELRQKQDLFESTGGLHAAALFDKHGDLDSLREDVGRHNAVDKLVGHALLKFRTPLHDSVMLVSGRASFELVQKASMAGVPILAAVGAPSSLAVATAERCGMTLIGFLRNGAFNVYNGSGCIGGLEDPNETSHPRKPAAFSPDAARGNAPA
jgi:FdhD protein